MIESVQDVITENGIRVNNILTGLILAATIGMVALVFDIKDSVGTIATTTLLNQAEIKHNTIAITRHENNKEIHRGTHTK